MTGAYLTMDGGRSYQQLNFADGASSFAFDPSDPHTLYIGATALHRSVDDGHTWQQIFPKQEAVIAATYQGDHATYRITTADSALYPQGESDQHIDHIRVDPADPNRIYVSMGKLFFYTTDAGQSWSRRELSQAIDFIYTDSAGMKDQVHIFTPQTYYTFDKKTHQLTEQILPKDMVPAFSFTGGSIRQGDQIIYYALHNKADENQQDEFGQSEVWVSADAGKSWKVAGDPVLRHEVSGNKPSFARVAAAERDALHAYVVCNQYLEKKPDGTLAHWYGALKTGDGGQHWHRVWKGGGGSGQYGVADGVGTANLKDAWVEQAFGGEYIRLIDAGVAPMDGKTAVVTDWYCTMKTVDGGQSWQEVYSKPQPDGGFSSRGMDVTTTYGVHFDPFDSQHIAISYTDIGYHHSFDGGKSWFRSVEGVPQAWRNTCYWVVFDPAVKGKVWSVWSSLHDFPRGKMTRDPLWAARGKGGVCVSTDGGKTWQPSQTGMGINAPSTFLVLDPRSAPDHRTLYVSAYNQGVFKSTDDGKTWTPKNQGIENTTGAFELTLAPDGTLFLVVCPTPVHPGGKTGRAVHLGAVYKSVDGAASWQKLEVGEKVGFPNGLAYDPANPHRLYLACWADITLSDLIGSRVAAATGGNEWLDFDGGIFMSADGGTTWQSIFDKDQYVYDVTVDPHHPGHLYCNTFNQAAYRSDDDGQSWHKLQGYDFHWGHRVIIDENDPEQVYLTTFGSSVWHSKGLVK